MDAGSFYDSYLWSTGETTSSITVTTPGIYTVVVQLNGCSATDTINVSYELCSGIPVENGNGISLFYDYENHNVQLVSVNGNYSFGISVEMINSLGQMIFSSGTIPSSSQSSLLFDLPGSLPEGVYLLTAKTGNQVIAAKSIVFLK